MNTSEPKAPATDMTKRSLLLMLLLTALAVSGCDFVDPTGVNNPTVTEETFLNTPNAAESWTRGVERQLAVAINQVVMGTEVVSDNVFNNRTLFSKVFDIPEIEASDFDVTNIQEEIHTLRAMADDGINVVVPADETAGADLEAQLLFYRGFAYLLSGELFVGLPAEPGGPVVSPDEHLARAIADFQAALGLTSDASLSAAAQMAIARAHYGTGNRTAAVTAAQQVKSSSPDMVQEVLYDNVDGPGNTMQFAVYDSPVGDEFQPLPRLDFLFPKYYSEFAGDESPIAILKGEEAFLILAEAALSQGDLDGAREELMDLLGLLATRPMAMVDDRGQERGRRGGTFIYPNQSDIDVASAPGAEPRAGLVLTRSEGLVEIPTLSGTSVTADMLDAATTEEDLLYLLYLMRQEIFVLEGRRMTDLGIRFPVALEEALTNDNIDEGSQALQALIPSFIPRSRQMDTFMWQEGDPVAVIAHDMNRALVENRSSEAVLPFH